LLTELVGVNSSKVKLRRVAQVRTLEQEQTKEKMEGFVMIKKNKERRERNNTKFKNKKVFVTFWNMTDCSFVEVYRRFVGTYCFRVHGSCHRCDNHNT
jgi:hypothetical protein